MKIIHDKLKFRKHLLILLFPNMSVFTRMPILKGICKQINAP